MDVPKFRPENKILGGTHDLPKATQGLSLLAKNPKVLEMENANSCSRLLSKIASVATNGELQDCIQRSSKN